MRGLLDQKFGRLSRPNFLSRRRVAPPFFVGVPPNPKGGGATTKKKDQKKPNHFVVGFFLSLKLNSLNLRDSFRVKSLMSLVSH
jgi:hypothetical protein